MNVSIYDMKKFITRTGVCMILLLALTSYGWSRLTSVAPVAIESNRVVTVEVGLNDTVWSIAKEFMPEVNTFDAVDRIIVMNDLGAQGLVRVGQKIILPIPPQDIVTVQAGH